MINDFRMRLSFIVLIGFALIGDARAQTFEDTAAYILNGLEAGSSGFIRHPEPPLRFSKPDESDNIRFIEHSPCVITSYIEWDLAGRMAVIETRSIDFSKVTSVFHRTGMNVIEIIGSPISYCQIVQNKCENVQWSKWYMNVDVSRLAKAVAHMKTLCRGRAF